MAEQLHLDDSIYNPYALDELADSHPALAEVFVRWVRAAADFDEGPLLELIAARGPEEVARHRAAGEAAQANLPPMIAALDELVAAIEQSLTNEPASGQHRERLNSLARAARHNRREFAERVPVLVAQALGAEASHGRDVQQAEALVNSTLSALRSLADEARDEAQDSRKNFSELRPLVSRLQQTWSQLDAGLSTFLPRAEARRLRRSQEPAMQAAARTTCLRLLEAKSRARRSGELTATALAARGDTMADRFATAILRVDYEGAWALLAPWLRAQWSSAELGARIAREFSAALTEAGLPAGTVAIPPADYETSSNSIALAELRRLRAASQEPVPSEITEKNFLGWVSLSILPDEEDGYLSGIDRLLVAYLIPVRMDGVEQIGMLAIGES